MAKTYTAVTAANATAGNAILASDHSTNFTNVNNLIVPSMCMLTYSTTQAVTTATNTVVTFDTAAIDTDPTMATTGAGAKITINTTGVYQVSYVVSFSGQAAAAGDRRAAVIKNGAGSVGGTGTNLYGWTSTPSALANNNIPVLSASFLMDLTATDYIQLAVYHTQGANVNVGYVNYGLPLLSAAWVGRKS